MNESVEERHLRIVDQVNQTIRRCRAKLVNRLGDRADLRFLHPTRLFSISDNHDFRS